MSQPTVSAECLETLGWTPSIYFAGAVVQCSLDYAWQVLVNYEAWNPTFVDAQVRRVRGERGKPGELVLIKKHLVDTSGAPLPEFYADTVVAIAPRRIIWYVYPVAGHLFRNFVDFGLSEAGFAVRFSINYYAQSARYGELTPLQQEQLNREREQSELDLQNSADAFKKYCETHVSSAN